MEPNPPGFNEADVVAGLRLAMNFGAPNTLEDRATFFWATYSGPERVDEENVPFFPLQNRNRVLNRRVVPAAVSFAGGSATGNDLRMGQIDTSTIEVTLLQPDYEQVKDFEYVVWGGDKYVRRTTETYALGSLDVWIFQCRAEDDQ